MTIEGHDCWEDCDEGQHGCVCGNDCEPLVYLDPKPWLFISDQIFGEFRSDHDKGYNNISGTWWAFNPRPGYNQNREDYA